LEIEILNNFVVRIVSNSDNKYERALNYRWIYIYVEVCWGR
jgi:hypothetical protein